MKENKDDEKPISKVIAYYLAAYEGDLTFEKVPIRKPDREMFSFLTEKQIRFFCANTKHIKDLS